MAKQVSRLYFGGKKNKNGKEQLHLYSKESIEDAERIKSYIIRLEGSFHKFINIDLEQMQNKLCTRIKIKIKQD